MPEKDKKDIVQENLESMRESLWEERIKEANDRYDDWANKFQVKNLEEFYLGRQWGHLSRSGNSNHEVPYMSNRFFVAIDIKMPDLLFDKPVFTITPKPQKEQFDEAESSRRATIRQDTLNTIVQDKNLDFANEIEMAILDAQFRFGVIEVNYDATWIENPNADKPLTTQDTDDDVSQDEVEIEKQPSKLPQNERVFVKHIQASNFRVGGIADRNLERSSWCGYWEWVYTKDVLTHPNYDVDETDLGSSSGISELDSNTDSSNNREDLINNQLRDGVVKIWKIWDLRAKKKLVILHGANKIIFERSFTRLPLKVLKFRELGTGFYPKPPTADWLSPQIEINEIREAARAHRRRMMRKWVASKTSFDESELEKLQFGGDGTIAFTNLPDPFKALAALPNADLGAQHLEMGQRSIEDFDTIAGVPAERRGDISNRSTATQSKILDKRADIRASRDRNRVSSFLCNIGSEILEIVHEKFSEDFWIKATRPLSENGQDFISERVDEWQQVNSEDFGDLKFEVSIEVESLSPSVQQQTKENLFEFLSVLKEFEMVALSPDLTREVANKIGYKNEKVIETFQKFALAVMLQQLQKADATIQAVQSGESGETGGNNLAQGVVAQESPNTQEQINNQLQNQDLLA